MAVRTVFDAPIAERVSAQYSVTLTSETGAPLGAGDLTALTLTIYALDAEETIVNSVDAVSVLNAGRGTLDANGLLTLTLLPDDNQLVDPTRRSEKHIWLLQGTWGGIKKTRHEVQVEVLNLAQAL